MPLSDMRLDALEAYRPSLPEPADFDDFWAATLAEARAHDLAPRFAPVGTPLTQVVHEDVEFTGFAGTRVHAWLALPAGASGPLPCVVEFPGYGGGRGLPVDQLLYACAGFAHLGVDVRGQGGGWRSSSTGDEWCEDGPHHPGFLTRGIRSPRTAYYRRVFADAVRAVEAARAHPAVDASRVAVAGTSQGGGLALAVAGLVPDLVAVAPSVPFLCHMRRGAEIATTGPYLEVAGYLKVNRALTGIAFETLSYFDAVHHAARATAPALFGVGLMDTTCPPSTVYAAYHSYAAEKRIEVYPFNGHEGGESDHLVKQLAFLHAAFGPGA
ncbi:acetylxylan esterase [Streptomyces sp. NPDC059740]|uniref:acetylxylan esterase n=1 Tax=Streptomyces sp. NPDC059740 TaxID=3346926 RepID=UPI003661CA54